MSIDGTSNRTSDDETPASTRENGDTRAEQAGGQQASPDDDRGHRRAETRTREEYADAIRASGPDGDHQEGSPDSGAEQDRDASGTVTHFHSEFKDRPLDLYTDGTRWAAAETPRTQETVNEKGDIPDQLPTGEELVDSAGESSSLLERLRHGVYEESDNETDVLEKEANLAHDVFSRPPTSSYEGTPSQPHIYATQHPGIDAGTAATAIFTVGLVIDRTVHWAMGYYDKHAKER